MTKGKNEKMKTTKIYFWTGGLLQAPPPPTPQLFPRQKFMKIFFIDTWISGQKVGKFLAKTQKWYEGKSEISPPERGG